jgi:hypothetical protein
VDAEELAGLLGILTGPGVTRDGDAVVVTTDDPRTRWVAEVAAYAHGWEVVGHEPSRILLQPVTP